VKKRHNTRFFVKQGDQKFNVEAGTVIDQQITHPTQFDFYLCSQAAMYRKIFLLDCFIYK